MDQLNHKILIADNEATTTTMHNNNSTADGQRQNENETVSPTSLMIPPGDEVSDSRSSMDDVEATAAAAAVEKGSNDGDTTTCTASTTKEPSTKTQTLGTASASPIKSSSKLSSSPVGANNTSGTIKVTVEKGRPILPRSMFQYGPDDVLLGRGVPIQRHPGNKRMHQIVDSNRGRYRNASRADKTALVRTTIQKIRQGGARFLKRVDEKELGEKEDDWKEVSEDTVYEKISHALRGNGHPRKHDSRNSRSSRFAAAVCGPPSSSPKRSSKVAVVAAAASKNVGNDAAVVSSAGTAETVNRGIPSLVPGTLATLLSNATLSSSHLGLLMSSLMGSPAPGTATAATSPSFIISSAQDLASLQLLQGQLLAQQQQLPSAQGSNPMEVAAGLELLLGGSPSSSQPPTMNQLSALMGMLQQQQQQPHSQLDVTQLLKLLLSTSDQGPPVSALSQLLQQRQQEQSRAEMLRRFKQEVAARQLAASFLGSSGDGSNNARSHHASGSAPAIGQDDLLLYLLLHHSTGATNPYFYKPRI